MRFSLKHHGQLSCVEHCPEGEYVLHSDYASLKSEVERLTLLQVETLDERNRAEADVKALRVELADAQESYHLVNERIAQILKQRAQS
jgi:hypothetical protein